jgi:hypothetical protein
LYGGHGSDLTAYWRKEAFLALADDFSKLARPPSEEHYEVHVNWHHQDEDCVFNNKRR